MPGTAGDALTTFNAYWRPRHEQYSRLARPPAWQPGLRLDADIHAEYERFLPVGAYLRNLYHMLQAELKANCRPPILAPVGPAPLSIADWWQDLPVHLAGRVCWQADELLPLACALASPEHFGTRAGRYPEQRQLIHDWLAAGPAGFGRRVSALDMGCGTGQGTWELAAWLPPMSDVLGVTREPLEVWMAQERRLPQLPGSADGTPWAFPEPTIGVGVQFRIGDLRDYDREPVDLLVCNGLVAGPAWHGAAARELAWTRFATLLRPGGLLLLGDSFHAGFAAEAAAFQAACPPEFRLTATAGRSRAWQRA